MVGIGSSNDALLQQRGKVIAIEMGAAGIPYESRFQHAKHAYHKTDYYVNATMSISSDPFPLSLGERQVLYINKTGNNHIEIMQDRM